MQPLIDQLARLSRVAGVHMCQHECVVDEFTLGAAATDADDILAQGLEQVDAGGVVPFGKGEGGSAYGGHHGAGSQCPGLNELGQCINARCG
jgi:hypothetical protein